jgi:putative transposase
VPESSDKSMAEHRKTLRRYHEPGDCHELTFSCFHRMRLLDNVQWRVLLAQSIENAMQAQSWHLFAYVLMPEHVHLLAQPVDPEPRTDLLLKAIKTPFSSRIKRLLDDENSPLLNNLTVQERPGIFCFRFWQAGGGYDRNLRSPTALAASINYIHENPVRRGLCQKPTDWQWSSARHYQDDQKTPVGPPTIHPRPWDLLA